MPLDFLRYLVPEKIDILGEILTLIERNITPLQVCEFWIAFKHSYLVWTLLRLNLSSLCGAFLIRNVLERFAFHILYIDFCYFARVVKKIRTFNRQMFASFYPIVPLILKTKKLCYYHFFYIKPTKLSFWSMSWNQWWM